MREMMREMIIGVGQGLGLALPLVAIGAASAYGIFVILLKLYGLWG